MKVGILTQHRVIHFGSVLQAYALQKTLLFNGIDSEIIDYIYPNKAHIKIKFKRTFRSIVAGWVYKIFEFLHLWSKTKDQRGSKIKKFIDENLIKSQCSFKTPQELSEKCPKYDIYLTGSDQVWNTDYLNGDTSFFFPFVKNTSRKVSYASSFGRFTFDGNKAKEWLSNLDSYEAISVREQKAAEIIEQYTGRKVDVVLDPTLLLDKNFWLDFGHVDFIIPKKYILVYVLTYAWNPMPYAENFIRYCEKTLGYEVVVLEPEGIIENNSNWKFISDPSPEEFVHLFANASFVITTSFHGVAFSINLEIPFNVIVNKNQVNDDRIVSLLNILGLEECAVMVNSSFPSITKINYTKVRSLLDIHRGKSLSFLLDSIR